MKRVLSIDLDYIAKPGIENYNSENYSFAEHFNSIAQWNVLSEFSDLTADNVQIDVSNLMFVYRLFLKALAHCSSVSFGYDHDAILYSIADFDEIDLIHIDHHDDFLHGSFLIIDEEILHQTGERRVIEHEQLMQNETVNEGNWIAWLATKKKLKNYLWICNENSGNQNRIPLIQQLFENFKCKTQNQIEFSSYEFDHIFVCLSPHYISPSHWHYFKMFMLAYEAMTQQSAENCLIHHRKFELDRYHDSITQKITQI